jgi:hypothetical protein
MTGTDSDAYLEEAIISYLGEHPNAAETREGIAEWWIMRRVVRAEVDAVTRVLRRLTDRGILEELSGGDQCRYRLKRSP